MSAVSVLLLMLATPLPAAAADTVQCNRDGTQLELNACAAAELAEADKQLNHVYKALLKKEAQNTVLLQKLRAAQRAWLAFRDAELDATFACQDANPRACWGSLFPMSYASYKAELTRERAKRLQRLLDGSPNG